MKSLRSLLQPEKWKNIKRFASQSILLLAPNRSHIAFWKYSPRLWFDAESAFKQYLFLICYCYNGKCLGKNWEPSALTQLSRFIANYSFRPAHGLMFHPIFVWQDAVLKNVFYYALQQVFLLFDTVPLQNLLLFSYFSPSHSFEKSLRFHFLLKRVLKVLKLYGYFFTLIAYVFWNHFLFFHLLFDLTYQPLHKTRFVFSLPFMLINFLSLILIM